MTVRRLLLPAAAVVAAVAAWDRLRGDRGLLFEAPPDWSAVYLFRSVILAAAGAAVVVAARRAATAWSRPIDDGPDDGGVWADGSALAANLVALTAAGLVVLDPVLLTRLVREDGVVEWASAALAFAASMLFAFGAVRLRRSMTAGDRRPAVVVLVALAGLSLLIGLEEVSWFQRVSGLESPAALRHRNQPEFNLHNGATDLSENLYYVGGFVITALIPGLLGDRRLPGRFASLDMVVPPRAVLYASAVASAVVYEMWNIVSIQLTFFATVVLVATQPSSTKRRSTALTALLVIVAGLFLGFGDTMIRSWDDTEVRELLLPFGLAVYGFGVIRRISALSNSTYKPSFHSDGGRSRRSSAQVTTR